MPSISRVSLGFRLCLFGLLLASSPIAPAFAQSPVPKEKPAEEDVVLLRVDPRDAEPSTVSIAGRLEGPPRGRPTGELVRDDLPAPIPIEAAILDRAESVVEVHLFPPPESDAAEGDGSPIKLLLEPGVESAAELEEGRTLWFELLSIGRQVPEAPAPEGR